MAFSRANINSRAKALATGIRYPSEEFVDSFDGLFEYRDLKPIKLSMNGFTFQKYDCSPSPINIENVYPVNVLPNMFAVRLYPVPLDLRVFTVYDISSYLGGSRESFDRPPRLTFGGEASSYYLYALRNMTLRALVVDVPSSDHASVFGTVEFGVDGPQWITISNSCFGTDAGSREQFSNKLTDAQIATNALIISVISGDDPDLYDRRVMDIDASASFDVTVYPYIPPSLTRVPTMQDGIMVEPIPYRYVWAGSVTCIIDIEAQSTIQELKGVIGKFFGSEFVAGFCFRVELLNGADEVEVRLGDGLITFQIALELPRMEPDTFTWHEYSYLLYSIPTKMIHFREGSLK